MSKGHADTVRWTTVDCARPPEERVYARRVRVRGRDQEDPSEIAEEIACAESDALSLYAS